MQLLAVLVALGALLDTCPTPSMAQSRRHRLPRPSQPSGSRGGSPSSPAPGMPALGPPPLELTCGDAADFVIVGGGTSGCVLAARICEIPPDASVVVLERGALRIEEHELLMLAPRLCGTAWHDPLLVEGWQSRPGSRHLSSCYRKTPLPGSVCLRFCQSIPAVTLQIEAEPQW